MIHAPEISWIPRSDMRQITSCSSQQITSSCTIQLLQHCDRKYYSNQPRSWLCTMDAEKQSLLQNTASWHDFSDSGLLCMGHSPGVREQQCRWGTALHITGCSSILVRRCTSTSSYSPGWQEQSYWCSQRRILRKAQCPA